MRRVEPAFPDLLPIGLRLGPVPPVDRCCRLDPVEMRLLWETPLRQSREGDRSVPRKTARLLVHAVLAVEERAHLTRLLGGGYGVLVVLDDFVDVSLVPQPVFPGQTVAMAPHFPALWGGGEIPDLTPWHSRQVPAGVLLGLAPEPDALPGVDRAVREARERGAEFVVPMPLVLPPEDRHRLYDGLAGDDGDEALENLLFHTDQGQLTLELEREATRACRRYGVHEGLPGPATALVGRETFAAGASMLLWARRLDLLDGVSSFGWKLRRAAHALVASGRSPSELVDEDNLRIVPGFTPWVEAFARSLWRGAGEPFQEYLERWVAL